MQWYNGGIVEAVSLSKSKGAIFVVYIEGQDDESKQISGLIENEEIGKKLNQDYFVAIKLAANSVPHQQFSELYKQTAVPSIYFIGKTGMPLKIITDVSDTQTFIKEIDEILLKAGLNKSKCSTTNLINVEQVAAAAAASSVPSSNVVCEGDVCTIRNGTVPNKDKNNDPNVEDKVERAKQLLEAKRIEKQREETENEKRKELERRKLGQDVQELKKMQAENELKQMKEEMARDKKMEKEARERILAQIAQDKADRAIKFQPAASSTPTLKETTGQITSSAPPIQSKSNSNTARLQFKLPNGSVHTQDFPSTDKFISVVNFVKSNLSLPYNDFVLSTSFPRKQFAEDDYTKTLTDLELIPSAVILILPLNKGTVTTSSGPNGFAGFIWGLFTPLFGIFNFIKSFLGFGDGSGSGGGGGGGASGSGVDPSHGFSQKKRFNGVIHIRSKYDLENRIRSAFSNLVVIDFFATWCGPCKMIAGDVEQLARENPNVLFVKVDVDENSNISQQYRVSAMPTFVFLKNGREVSRFQGADSSQLRSTIQRYR